VSFPHLAHVQPLCLRPRAGILTHQRRFIPALSGWATSSVEELHLQSPTPPPAIAQLATGALRAAEPEAWRLFEQAWLSIERFVLHRLRRHKLSDRWLADCGQEVVTRVWKFRTGYRGTTEPEFWRWLCQICDNEVRRTLGRAGRNVPGTLPTEGGDEALIAKPDGLDTAGHEELAALRECLARLDAERRRVVEWAYLEPSLSERAIAELLECSSSNVHKLKHEGLRWLAACLARKGVQ
jgi:RNA polymerase sigma factor (sigma-70 family)